MSDLAAFHAERLTGIGGSDAAAAVGLSDYSTPLELYREKRGEVPPFSGNEFTWWGLALEPVIRVRYEMECAQTVKVPPMVRSARHPFMICHPDGLRDDGRNVQIKTSRNATGWGEPGTANVPLYVMIQVQHEMAVMEVPITDVPVLIAGSDYRVYVIEADRELQQLIIDGEAELWDRVQRGDPPEVSLDNPRALEILKRVYPGTDGSRISAPPALEPWLDVYRQSAELAKRYETTKDEAQAHILHAMGPAAEMLFASGFVATRKQVNRRGYEVAPTQYIDLRIKPIKDKELTP